MLPSLNREEVTRFGVFMVKAVLNGRGDERVELAGTNLFR
jgi:hypothetical protein